MDKLTNEVALMLKLLRKSQLENITTNHKEDLIYLLSEIFEIFKTLHKEKKYEQLSALSRELEIVVKEKNLKDLFEDGRVEMIIEYNLAACH